MTKHIDRLTRYEADIVVRQLTGRYYEKYGRDDSERFDDFAAKLAWQVGGQNTSSFRGDLLGVLGIFAELDADYWARRPDNSQRDYWEGLLNLAVHDTLSAANIPGEMSRYYTQPVAA